MVDGSLPLLLPVVHAVHRGFVRRDTNTMHKLCSQQSCSGVGTGELLSEIYQKHLTGMHMQVSADKLEGIAVRWPLRQD